MFQLFWFIGTFADKEAGEEVLHTILTRNLDELKTIGQDRSWQLIQVDMAVPAGESQTGELECEPLVAAWDYEDCRYPNGIARVYYSIQGLDYTDVIPPIEPTKLRRLRRVYPTRETRRSQWSRVRGRAALDMEGDDGQQDKGFPGAH